MPKITGTRRQKARELLKTLEDGPAWDGPDRSREQYVAGYHLWARTWVIPLVKELVRELHPPKSPKE